MRRKDLVPLKVVAEEMGVSRTTLWRASRSRIPGFPAPVLLGRMVFWRKGDFDHLEDALLRYPGRMAFERRRVATAKIQKLAQARARFAPGRKRKRRPLASAQQSLF